MVELSNERVEQILNEETQKTEELTTILRGIYTRYMRLYEKYFDDIEALNNEKIDELKKYNEETRSLVKYYYMDIPLDICMALKEFDNNYSSKLLGSGWHEYLFGAYNDFGSEYGNEDKSKECLKKEFEEKNLDAFYDCMDYIFREGFSTSSETAGKLASGFAGMLFGE